MLDVTLRRKSPSYLPDATAPQRLIDGLRALGERLGEAAHDLYLRGPREGRVRSLQPLSPELLGVECQDEGGGVFLVLGAVESVQFEVRRVTDVPAGPVPGAVPVMHAV